MDPIEDPEVDACFEALNQRLDEGTRQLKLILKWFEEFEDLAHWMRSYGFWDAEDIDKKNPMNTYKNGLKNFCRKHNIELTRKD